LDKLLPVLLRGIQIVPLVGYAGQAKTRLAGDRLRRITRQLQDASVALGGQRQPVVRFLQLTEIYRGRYGVDGIP
jgi:hypothetical protein